MKERAYMYVPLVISKNMIHLRVCRMMSLVFVILDSWFRTTGSLPEIISIPTDVVEFYMKALNCFIFSHHHDAGTFVNHNLFALYALSSK